MRACRTQGFVEETGSPCSVGRSAGVIVPAQPPVDPVLKFIRGRSAAIVDAPQRKTVSGLGSRPLSLGGKATDGLDPPPLLRAQPMMDQGEKGMSIRLRTAARRSTYSEIAQRTGQDSETVRRYFRTGRPTVSFLAVFCREYGVRADWLLEGTNLELTPAQPPRYTQRGVAGSGDRGGIDRAASRPGLVTDRPRPTVFRPCRVSRADAETD